MGTAAQARARSEIRERIISVENRLFILKARESFLTSAEREEIERLDRLHEELLARYERAGSRVRISPI